MTAALRIYTWVSYVAKLCLDPLTITSIICWAIAGRAVKHLWCNYKLYIGDMS